MAGVAVDLHIHSCLSPCGDELMTPNNIVRMSALKGLELIAVTDHNTARQLPAVEKVCRKVGSCRGLSLRRARRRTCSPTF
ncbi:MAG: PHP domain-containing protein [Clostridia bacterium]